MEGERTGDLRRTRNGAKRAFIRRLHSVDCGKFDFDMSNCIFCHMDRLELWVIADTLWVASYYLLSLGSSFVLLSHCLCKRVCTLFIIAKPPESLISIIYHISIKLKKNCLPLQTKRLNFIWNFRLSKTSRKKLTHKQLLNTGLRWIARLFWVGMTIWDTLYSSTDSYNIAVWVCGGCSVCVCCVASQGPEVVGSGGISGSLGKGGEQHEVTSSLCI